MAQGNQRKPGELKYTVRLGDEAAALIHDGPKRMRKIGVPVLTREQLFARVFSRGLRAIECAYLSRYRERLVSASVETSEPLSLNPRKRHEDDYTVVLGEDVITAMRELIIARIVDESCNDDHEQPAFSTSGLVEEIVFEGLREVYREMYGAMYWSDEQFPVDVVDSPDNGEARAAFMGERPRASRARTSPRAQLRIAPPATKAA